MVVNFLGFSTLNKLLKNIIAHGCNFEVIIEELLNVVFSKASKFSKVKSISGRKNLAHKPICTLFPKITVYKHLGSVMTFAIPAPEPFNEGVCSGGVPPAVQHQRQEPTKRRAVITPIRTQAFCPCTLTAASCAGSGPFISHFSSGDISGNILEIHSISQGN